MNILYLCDEYPPGQHGGIGTVTQLTARQLVKMGHSVVVAGLYSPGYGGEDEFEDEGVQVYRFRNEFNFAGVKNRNSLWIRISNRTLKAIGVSDRRIKKNLAAYQAKLEQIIVKYNIDIIEMPDYNDYIRHCKGYIPFPQLSKLVVIKLNGSISYFLKEANKPVPPNVFKMEQTILNQATAVASASRYTAAKSAAYFTYTKPIQVLYNGINTHLSVSHSNKNPKQVIFTGTLVAKKGIHRLAKAWNIVNESMPDACLLILGKGPQQRVKNLLNTDAINSVTFMGHVPTEELYRHLNASLISVFPSYSEAFALAPLEAMACGTAVINSNRTSGTELTEDHVDGLLIDPDDVEQIARSILYLLNNPRICANLANKGKAKVRNYFDIGKIAQQNIEFYSSVLRKV